MVKAIGYIRVSTADQAEHGVSLEAQRERIAAYCKARELDLVEIVADEGISAKDMHRPGLARLLDMTRRREIQAVVILKLDRMFRNTADALATTSLLDRRGVALHSVQETIDTRGYMGRFVFRLMASLAEMERDMTIDRTRTAMQHKRARGERVSGHAPYGFRHDAGRLVPVAEEADALDTMRRLRARGATYQGIADRLNSDGVSTRTGAPWNRVQVFKIMRRAAA